MSSPSLGDWSRVNYKIRNGSARKSLAKVGEGREEVSWNLNRFVVLRMEAGETVGKSWDKGRIRLGLYNKS